MNITTEHNYFHAGHDWVICEWDTGLFSFSGFPYSSLDLAQAAVRRYCRHKGL